MKYKNLILLSFLILSAASFGKDNFEMMATILKNVENCRINSSKITDEQVLKAASCYQKYLSKKLSSKEAAGLSTWFNSVEKINDYAKCNSEKLQLKSYSEYTDEYICVKVKSLYHGVENKVIFFNNEDNKLLIKTIYSPFSF